MTRWQANQTLDRMTGSAVSRMFQVGRHWHAPRHRSAIFAFDRGEQAMTIFHVLPLAGVMLGLICGAKFGLGFGSVAGVFGAVAGGVIGFFLGWIPLILVLKSVQRDYRRKTIEELRGMLRNPGFPAPNTVLLELGARGEDLEPELPVVLDMLAAQSRERRIRGWHALASAFPERAKLITDYRIDDAPEECQRKIQKLRIAESGAVPDGGPAA